MSKTEGIPERRRAMTVPDKRGRSGKRGRRGNPVSRPSECGSEQFVWLPRELLETKLWAGLTISARRTLDRLMLEHVSHGGVANGELSVSYRQFEKFGVSRNSVSRGIKELEAVGLIEVRRRGRIAGQNAANFYRLTWMGSWSDDGEIAPPRHSWKRRAAADLDSPRSRKERGLRS